MPATDSSLPLVITMWENHGFRMAPVAARVGELLGIPVYSLGPSPDELERVDAEYPGTTADVTRQLAAGGTPANVGSRDTDAAFKEIAQKNIELVQAKAEGGGVIRSRSGAFILRDRPNTLHIKLEGIGEERVERAARPEEAPARSSAAWLLTGETEEESTSKVVPWDPRDIESYDAILNTSFQDPEETAQFIVAMARVKSAS